MSVQNSRMSGAIRETYEGTSDGVTEAKEPRSNQRRSAYLVTAEDSLWPLVGAVVSSDTVLTQIDSIGQLLGAIEPEHAGVVIWDARGDAAYAEHLAQLQRHSARLAVMVLDDPGMSSHWSRLVQKKQIVSSITLPLTAQSFNDEIRRACDEVQVRTALLAADHSSQPRAISAASKSRVPAIIIVGAVVAAMAALLIYKIKPSPPVLTRAQGTSAPAAPAATLPMPGTAQPSNPSVPDDSVDALLEKAAQAMLDRRYIDPTDNSALDYYRRVLVYDATNAEATQGLNRLEGLLVTKAQTALDQRSFESALQALEIARTINRDDPRLQGLDSRLAKMRSELGATAIQAALNAGNYERAATLIDEAAQAKALPAAQIAQLREATHTRRDGADLDRYLKTAQIRTQQGRLIDPANDSAAHWFALAERGGASSAALSAPLHEFGQRLMGAARSALDQGRLSDAERLLTEAKLHDVPPAAIGELQNALTVAGQRGQQNNERQHFVDLVNARVAKGELLEPNDDNALFYLNALKALDPKNASLPSLGQALQSQLLARANSLLDQNQTADAEKVLQSALNLGPSAAANAVADRISMLAQSPLRPSAERAHPNPDRKLLKPIVSKYPVEAAEKGLEGWVDLRFNVLPNGRTGAVHVLDSSPRTVFDDAARDAVLAARYERVPGWAPQVPVEAEIRLTFKLAAR